MKFGRFWGRYCKANIRKFSLRVHTEIYGVFEVKNGRNFNRQVQNVTATESKHLQLPEPVGGRCIRRPWTRTGTL